MTEIMPVPRNLILLSYQQGASPLCFFVISRSLAEFTARRRQKIQIVFPRDMCVGENTAQAASVEFVCHRHANYARSRL